MDIGICTNADIGIDTGMDASRQTPTSIRYKYQYFILVSVLLLTTDNRIDVCICVGIGVYIDANIGRSTDT